MKAIVVITDSDEIREFERSCLAIPGRGFTVVPTVVGRGKTGFKAGDRVHPGASTLLFTVVPDDALDSTLACIKDCRDRAGVRDATKIFVSSVEDVSEP